MQQLGERALRFILAHGDKFGAGARDAPLRLKRLGELSFLAGALADAERPEGATLLDEIWRALDEGEALRLAVAHWPHVATIYPALWRHGRRNRALEETLRQAGGTSTNATLRLLVTCALAACELVSPSLLAKELSGFCAQPVVPERCTRLEAYALAHVVLYLTPAGLLPPALADAVRRDLPGLIEQAVATGEIDILAELVWCAHRVGGCGSERAWETLRSVQEEDGLVPFFARRRDGDDAAVRFDIHYHSTLVTAAAALTCHYQCRR